MEQCDDCDPIVTEESFYELGPESCQSVPVSDEECVEDPSLSHGEESSESTTPHVESGANVREDHWARAKPSSTLRGEGLELPDEVTIGLLSVTGDPGIDRTSTTGGGLEEISVYLAK